MHRRTLLLTALLLAAGAATAQTMLNRATVRVTTVTVTWAKDNRHANTLCMDRGLHHSAAGCAWGTVEDCRIVVVQPKDFNDQAALAVLGHEVWHCLGARHD